MTRLFLFVLSLRMEDIKRHISEGFMLKGDTYVRLQSCIR